MHEHQFISFGPQEHAFLGSIFQFIQITWFTYALSTFAGCPNRFSLQNSA